jgi:hypothetical protein
VAKNKKSLKIAGTYFLAVLMLALWTGTTHAQTALDNVCKALGDFARVCATERDNGRPIAGPLEDVDEAFAVDHEMRAFRARWKREDIELIQKIYAHPDITPTQFWHIAVNACFAAHGIND